MPKPTAINTTNADAGTDSPSTFRADVLDLISKFNAVLAQMTSFMWDLLSSTDAPAARTALGASTVGSNVFTAADQAAARSALGATPTGTNLFTAVDAVVARSIIGAADNGQVVFTTTNQTVAGLKTFSDSFRASNSTVPFGYTVGAGAVGVQSTSKTTAVTLNRVCGQIQSAVGSIGAGANFEFVFNNSSLTSASVLILNPNDVNGSFSYRADVLSIGSGVANIRVTNVTGGARNEAVVLNFAVIRGTNT